MTTQQRELYWQQQLADWLDSGLSGAAFCKQHALSYHKFTYWRRKLREPEVEPSQSAGSAGFARVTAVSSTRMHDTPASELTLTLPGGIAITGLHAGNVDLLGAILGQL